MEILKQVAERFGLASIILPVLDEEIKAALEARQEDRVFPAAGGALAAEGYGIMLMESLRDFVSDAELEAICLHEAGHLVLDHLKGFAPSGEKVEVLVDLKKEIEADAWAVSQGVHPHIMASALLAAMDHIEWFIEKCMLLKGKNPEVAKHNAALFAASAGENLEERFDVLMSMGGC